MLLATELVPSSQVSTRDVSYSSPSHNIPLDQYRNGSVASFEPAKISVAMAGFIIATDSQQAISTREHKLQEQLVLRRCSTGPGGVMADRFGVGRTARCGEGWK
ncbi:MAG: hypothetical protein KGL01_05580 [Betaproteobacteria bacterium]|nr:hypothetical protein [Betaproteobacteria bacterium]